MKIIALMILFGFFGILALAPFFERARKNIQGEE